MLINNNIYEVKFRGEDMTWAFILAAPIFFVAYVLVMVVATGIMFGVDNT